MGLFQKACETYDNFAHLAGIAREGKATLLPISHIMQKAQIEITIDSEGRFIRAVSVEPSDCKTVIPATEKSASRTRQFYAHPYSDQLDCVCSINKAKHNDYVKELSAWGNSPYSHAKVKAVLRYVEQDTILKDLVTASLIKLKSDGTLDKGKIEGTDYPKCLIRWRVVNTGEVDASWQDITLLRKFIEYYQSCAQGPKDLCMINGTTEAVTTTHAKGTIAGCYSAKLISANDDIGFTFRGRFSDASQASTISYLASQKAHNALQWIVSNQGVNLAGRTFVCWNPQGKIVFNFMDSFLFGAETAPVKDPTEYRQKVWYTLNGYRNELPQSSDVVIAAFDAATTGRLSLTYYNELRASDFYDRVECWYETCCWLYGTLGIQSPTIKDIVRCALGTERGAFIELDDRILKEQAQRFLTCIISKARISQDIVHAVVQRASLPLAYKQKKNRNKVLSTACAIVRKYHNDNLQKEEWTLALQEEKHNRSYQFGRMLAIFEKIERDTYDQGDERDPNAIRLQAVYREQPWHYTNIIHLTIQPYLSKLNPGQQAWYRNLISSIMGKLSEFPESDLNRPLEDIYLMGYYLQRQSLYTKKEILEKTEEE